MQSAIPALTALDQSILAAAHNFTSNLWDAYGAPCRKTTEEIAEQIDSHQVDVHYAMKALKRKGHLGHSGVVMNPASPTTAEGFFSVQDVMRNMNAAPIELEPVEDAPCEETINSALKTFCAATELGYEWVDPECYSPQDVARLTAQQTMSVQELSQASESMFFAASTLASYLDECWVKMGAKTPDRWTSRIEECRVEFQGFLNEFVRPMGNTDVDLVRNALLGCLRELERLTERALRDLANQKSPAPPPQMPSPVQTHIDALRKAMEQHVPADLAIEIIPTLQSDLANRITFTKDKDFPDALTSNSLFGILKDFVDAALPCTEADQHSLAYQFLCAIGNVFGTTAYAQFGADKHFPAIFQLILGETSCGKGQAWTSVRSLMDFVDPAWKDRCKYSAASGEGLVRLVSESEDDPRVFAVLPEVSILLNSMNREGSNLSGYLRQSYDRLPLELNRARLSYKASDYLLSCLGHSTPSELTENLSNVDFYNGVANRFIWAAVRRSKVLPRMSRSPDFTSLAEKIRKLLSLPAPGLVNFTLDGEDEWDRWVHSLSEPTDGKLAATTQREKPNALRLSLLYALIDEDRLDVFSDGSCAIDARHVRAAAELIGRSRQTVEWFLNRPNNSSQTSQTDLLKLRTEVNKNSGHLTASRLKELFPHKTADQRAELATRAGLKARKTAVSEQGGRPSTIWAW